MAKIATTQKKQTVTTAKKQSTQSSSNDAQATAALAYQFFLERGGQHGFDSEDWYRAEKIIRARKYNS